MPKLTVEGVGTFEIPQGKRLVLAVRRPGACHQPARTDSSRRPATATSTQPKPHRSVAPRRPVCPGWRLQATRDTSRIRHSAVPRQPLTLAVNDL